jgi:YcxB-like protein
VEQWIVPSTGTQEATYRHGADGSPIGYPDFSRFSQPCLQNARVPESPPPSFDLDDCAFGSVSLTLGDFAHAIRHEPRTRALLRWATAIGATGTALGIWLITTPDVATGVGALVLGLSCFAAHNAPDHAASRWFQKTPLEARSLRYTVKADELIVVSDVSRHTYPWHALEGYHEAPDAFLLWVNQRSFLILPKRAFAPGDVTKVAARLSSEVGAPPELPRFWSWLLISGAAALAVLWLWNRLAPR